MEFSPQKPVNSQELKKPFDAMVYIDGTTVIAVDSEGTTIASGTAGTDDSTVIQAAINSLTSGGTVILGSGSYTITASLNINYNYIELIGQQAASLSLAANVNDSVLKISGKNYITIRNLKISGNKNNNTDGNGIYVYGSSWLIRLINVDILNCKSNGILIGDGTNVDQTCSIINCASEGNLGNGIKLFKTTYTYVENCFLEGNNIGLYIDRASHSNFSGIECNLCVVGGVYLESAISCHLENIRTSNNSSGTYGIYASASTGDLRVSNVSLISNPIGTYGIRLSSSTLNGAKVSGVRINGFSDGIYLSSGNYNVLESNLIESCTRGININAGLNHIVKNNIFLSCSTPCTGLVTSSIISDNIGYVNVPEIRASLDNILEKLGTPRLISPFAEITSTSVTDYTRLANTLTASTSVATWYGFQGRATYYDFNGTTHYLYRADDADFTFTDSAFSVIALVSPDAVADRTIIAKWDETTSAEKREWRFFFDASGYPTFQCYDESADAYIGRQDQTAFPTTANLWRVLIATYDGTATSAGIKIYIDGVQLDDADSVSGTYIAMENLASQLYVGAQMGAAAVERFFDGKYTWPCIAAKELSSDEAWSITQRLKGVLGI